MKKVKLLFLMVVVQLVCVAQKIDTIIVTKGYTSYYSYQLLTPVYVKYTLSKGGGGNSRAGLQFKSGGINHSASLKDYNSIGYDIGHMANAEDFANDKVLEESTFRFYNAIPQTPKCNRGCWKTLETQIRKQSQTDVITIWCGRLPDELKKIGKDSVSVPKSVFKVYKTKNGIFGFIFPNDDSDSFKQVSKQTIETILGFKLD